MNKNIEINADNIEMHYYTDKFFLNYEMIVKWGAEFGVGIDFRIGRNKVGQHNEKYTRLDIDSYVYSAMIDLNEYFHDYVRQNKLDNCEIIIDDNILDKLRQFILKTVNKKENDYEG